MKTRLLVGLDENEAEEVKREYLSASRLRKRISDLLQKDIDGIHASMRNEPDYALGSWPYFQAEKIGEVKALLKIISLFE
jgi:hypothetical protein